ncbi:BRO family protein [Methylobacterium sp. EM32]|uniref:BRO-N domain-containing protein n=1 Tax=Methylobacterium sp. EM32 TaxID=3163481 RepID=UPI0033A451E1
MSAIVPFLFEARPVRVIDRAGAPWFVAADVCGALAIANSRDAIARLDADEKGVGTSDTPGGKQEVTLISESGLYTLILRCQGATTPGTLPHRFRKWVTGEVLPSIRSRGGYAPQADQHREALRMVAECRRTFGKAAAQRLWVKVGLPAVSGPSAPVLPLPADEIETFIRQANRPVTRSELYRRVDGRMDARQLDTVMRDLVDSGRVEMVVERTPGRSRTTYRTLPAPE